MELSELKDLILNDDVVDNFMIFRCKCAGKKPKADCFFIADQYVDEICDRYGLTKNIIDSLYDIQNSALSLVFDFSSNLNVLKVQNFDEVSQNYAELTNTIVICNSVDKKIESIVADYIVDFPVAPDWAVLDYMQTICPGLNRYEYDWLYNITKGDLNRITNELDKVILFNEKDRLTVFNAIRYEHGTDLYNVEFYDLINAIINKNLGVVYDYLHHMELFDYDAIGMTTALLLNFKKLLYIRYGNNQQIVDAGISSGSLYMINKSYRSISLEEIQEKIAFLSNIDFRLKSCELEADKYTLLSYVICHILN